METLIELIIKPITQMVFILCFWVAFVVMILNLSGISKQTLIYKNELKTRHIVLAVLSLIGLAYFITDLI